MKAFLYSLLLLLPATPASAWALYWSSVDVHARLDADGLLHVSERQAMVFDGAWNGGERDFGLRPGEKLRLKGIARQTPSGGWIELTRGNLDDVDDWDWESQGVLRWRSRLPSDPLFENQTLVYRIDYTLRGAVRDAGPTYELRRDFGFAERSGPIERFTFVLDLDPAWRALDPLGPLDLGYLPPGQQAIINVGLEHVGSGTPSAVDRSVPTRQIYALAVALLSLLGLKLTGLWRAETAQGRRERPDVPEPVTREWLDEHLFSLLPEEAGALWDRRVAAPEVAAMIARLVSEGKLSSRVRDDGRWYRQPTMELDLVADREELTGYERTLIDKLFFDERTTIDTKALREHYSSTGLAPATVIRPGIDTRLKRIGGGGEIPPNPSWRPTAALFVAFVAAVGLEAVNRGAPALAPLIAALAVVGVAPGLWAYIAAAVYRAGLGRPPVAWWSFLLPLGLLATGCVVAAWSGSGGRELFTDLRPGLFGVLALTIFPLLIGNSVLNTARTRERRGIVARRQQLAAARRYFAVELKRPTPNLQDGWFPYVLAFGLSKRADRWARRFGGRARTGTPIATNAWRRSSGAGWSGGGGSFGGVGATAAWTAAATGMASGVSKPSSGGSGGGGGSVGGGGGGGW